MHSKSLHLGREVPFYTLLGHSRCQSKLDEIVSMASRPVKGGIARMGSVSTSFHPVKSGFGRTKENLFSQVGCFSGMLRLYRRTETNN